jgi:hypothetical protein
MRLGHSGPFISFLASFSPTAEDIQRVALLAHELDNQALTCLEASTCEEVHFARGLVSLFENQEAASASFHRAIESNPSSALSASSRLWLKLINDEGSKPHLVTGSQPPVLALMAQLVRGWMTRELADHTKPKQVSEPITHQHTMGDAFAAVRALQKQVRERDRRIAILQSQMEDLKLIDEDHENRKRAIKLPGTVR